MSLHMERQKRILFHIFPWVYYVYKNIWNSLHLTVSWTYEAHSIRSFDDEKQYTYFIALLYVDMRGTGNTRELIHIGDVTEGCHPKL